MKSEHSSDLIVKICDGCIKSASASERIMMIPNFKVHINEKMWNSVYKTNGELSTMTSQILTELPTQGSPMTRIH